jgi:hypothetical protein
MLDLKRLVMKIQKTLRVQRLSANTGVKIFALKKHKIVFLSYGIHNLFPTELHFKNVYYLYSACSNPTDVVLLIVLSMIIGKSAWYWDRNLVFGKKKWQNIKTEILTKIEKKGKNCPPNASFRKSGSR